MNVINLWTNKKKIFRLPWDRIFDIDPVPVLNKKEKEIFLSLVFYTSWMRVSSVAKLSITHFTLNITSKIM